MLKSPLLHRRAANTASAGRCSAIPSASSVHALALPSPSPLATLVRGWHALGPVLWLWRATAGQPADLAAIVGWNCVHRVEPDGVCEALRFFRADGREVARLYLLPDSDYLVWEQLLHRIPCAGSEAPQSLHQRLRIAALQRVGPPWQASLVRFCHGSDERQEWLLTTSAAHISRPGQRRVADICEALHARLADAAATLSL